jgi:tRNA1Val (adenine37-N6)-methyltransferase
MLADVMQSQENILKSPWSTRVSIVHQHLQEFQTEEPFDLIVSNPPFFSNSQLPPSEQRKNVRHTETLTHEELIVHAKRLLSPQGRFAVVLPVVEGEHFKREAAFAGFFLQRTLAFFSRDSKPQERFLFEFARYPAATKEEKLTLYEGMSDVWTHEYKNLMRDFYLHL